MKKKVKKNIKMKREKKTQKKKTKKKNEETSIFFHPSNLNFRIKPQISQWKLHLNKFLVKYTNEYIIKFPGNQKA